MNLQDKQLIEEMFRGQTKYLHAQFETIHENFDKVNNRLDKLNGKVAEHEKTLNQNIPHTVAHCAQSEVITDLRDNMVTSRGIKKVMIASITGASAVAGIIWVIFQAFIKPLL
jgi:DNA-binding ferritin-like protein